MSEIYSKGERAVIFLTISIISMVSSLIYLCCRVDLKDRKKTSWYIFLLCLIYSFFFVFINIIAMFDLCFNNVEGFEKFSKVISVFYEIFNITDKVLGFIIFPMLIYIFESGYHSKRRKFYDGICGIFREFYQTVTRSFGIIFFCGIIILILIIIFRNHFGLGKNPMDYLDVILDCYGIYDIYTCVGFFIVQIFIDCRRQSKVNLTNRYYRYSVIKIINKADSDINKMKHLYEVFNKEVQNYNKEKSSSDYNYLKDSLDKIGKKIKMYESEGNSINANNDLNNIPDNSTTNITNNNNSNMQNNIIVEPNFLKNNINQKIDPAQSKANNKLGNTEEQTQKVEIKTEEKEKEKKEDPVKCKKKFKKYVRRIDKLKKLYKEIGKENRKDIKIINEKKEKNKKNKKCVCYYIIFFIAFFIAIITDFLVPIALNMETDFVEEDKKEYEKEKSILELILGILFSIVLSVVCCSYTLITIYSTKRRRYITGDFLYDRQINDNISLMKTVQIICGFSFAIIFCNLYFWLALDKKGVFGRPHFYDHIIIPDYTISHGISILMVIKIIIIIVSIIGNLFFSKKSIFKNDLAEYNLSRDGCEYDDPNTLNKIIEEKKNIYNILNNEVKIKI